ncbi:hypothetical protein GLOIN_2v1472948 [Rhizophagus clarus]|uniref:Restriction endonuclease type IV Mrr domain-containing protein n=1 Tax=Rhizophagus clarus TaxID=94130 RepID=A0A8H3MB44_9GLOM|nr:hypothetical protein GLOIN_2v1472948 [Rhizophagus clarus]
MSDVSAYFLITPPRDYKFIDYYNYRKQQLDFTFSFDKESCILSMELKKLIKENYSQEIALGASRLYNRLKDHRTTHPDVKLFWDEIELSVNSMNLLVQNAQVNAGNILNLNEAVINNILNNNQWRAIGQGISTNHTPIVHSHPDKVTSVSVDSKLPADEKPNLDYSGYSFSSDDETRDAELIKFVHDGLKTLGMRSIITRDSYINPVTNKAEYLDNGGVDIIAWYKEMEVLIQCKGSNNPVTTETVQELEHLLLKHVNKVGCIVSELNFNQDVINMVKASKRKIILTTKSKAYFDIEIHYNTIINAIKSSKQATKQAPILHNDIFIEDMRIEVVKGNNDDEVNVLNYGQIGVKGKGNTKLNISCKKLHQKNEKS